MQTPIHFIPFVPDSPTASLFFVFVLIAFLSGKNWPLLEALAAVTLIKYGLWAVVMNTAAGIAGDTLNWTHYMLIFSHLGMAIQAVLYAPFFRIKTWHIVVTALWTVHNDIIDYLFGMQPWLSRELMPWINEIGYFTFWLSIFSIAVVYFQQQWQQKRSIEGG
ncbi:putative membrane protein YpjA [Texcoconibacillus texcoconensis]|uniref:Putative membrane protein YpjA n=1 Tax=Texcoconibacillus texcoconensis TaxID=1095777 RepID=A0A840QNC0_9BACI|nr:putative membrane protein YpjA [Texcoconibacillus texcoconensis]